MCCIFKQSIIIKNSISMFSARFISSKTISVRMNKNIPTVIFMRKNFIISAFRIGRKKTSCI